MIDTLTLKNFKAFKHLDNLKLKPITILCGTNSSGKSSVLQSILLLKQTIESQQNDKVVLLNGNLAELGSLIDLINEKDKGKTVELAGKVNLSDNELKKIEPLITKLLPRFSLSDLKYVFRYKIVIGAKKDSINNFSATIVNELLLSFNSTYVNTNKKCQSGFVKLTLQKDSNDYFLIETKTKNYIEGEVFAIKNQKAKSVINIERNSNSIDAKIKFGNLFPVKMEMVKSGENYIFPPIFLLDFKNLFQTIFEKYNYIGPLRQEPHREYIFRNEVSEIGTKGENAAYFYWMEREKLIENHYFYNATKDKFNLKSESTLLEAVRYWLDLMGIQNFKPLLVNGIIYLELDSATGEGTKVGLADVGFGVSQIFPIVLEGLRMDKGNTLILEQPEIHLHPRLQMQMADFFVSMALSDKRVLVETHSDHVVNRLVRRIVEDEEHDLASLIGIYFIQPGEDGATYEEVQIDAEKGIVNWPEGFFDQTATEQEKIIRAGLKKRMAKRAMKNN